jgi:hypothetical protein
MLPRFTWPLRPDKLELLGATAWVRYTFKRPVRITASQIYWFVGSSPSHQVQKVARWRLLVLESEGDALADQLSWKEVDLMFGNYNVTEDEFNIVTFDPVRTSAIQLEIQSAPGKSGGLFEWRVLDGAHNVASSGRTSYSFHDKGMGGNLAKCLNAGDQAPDATALVPVRELMGFTPWYFDLPDHRRFDDAWVQVMSPEGFFAPFGLTTVEQRSMNFMLDYGGHPCLWNGPSWPYASSITLTALANLLQAGRGNSIVSKEDYTKLLEIYLSSHRRRVNNINGSPVKTLPWIDENLDPFTGKWLARKRHIDISALKATKTKETTGAATAAVRAAVGLAARLTEVRGDSSVTRDPDRALNSQELLIREKGKDYLHSTFCDLIITGLVGLRPRPDHVVELQPLLPAAKWAYFCLDRVKYRGWTLTVVWDQSGKKYGKGQGLLLFVDGRLEARSATLEPLKWDGGVASVHI